MHAEPAYAQPRKQGMSDPADPSWLPRRAEPVTVWTASGPGMLFAKASAMVTDIWLDEPGLLQVVFHDPGPGGGHGEFRDRLVADGISPTAIRLARETAGPAVGSLNGTVCALITSTGRADIAALAASGRDIAVHHLNVPRGGRDVPRRLQADFAVSQRTPGSRAYRYVAIGTRDDLRWMELERYAAAISDDPPLTWSELAALASGRPLASVRAEAEIARLELAWTKQEAAGHDSDSPRRATQISALDFPGPPVSQPGAAPGNWEGARMTASPA
jgi:hypothetical protein